MTHAPESTPEINVINSMPYSGMCVTPPGVIFLPLAVSGVEENTENQHEQTALIGRCTASCKSAHNWRHFVNIWTCHEHLQSANTDLIVMYKNTRYVDLYLWCWYLSMHKLTSFIRSADNRQQLNATHISRFCTSLNTGSKSYFLNSSIIIILLLEVIISSAYQTQVKKSMPAAAFHSSTILIFMP